MNLTTPARDWTDTQLEDAYQAGAAEREHQMRRQPLPLRKTVDYSLHTAECAADDDGPAGDLRSMQGLVLAIVLSCVGSLALLVWLAWLALGPQG